MRYLILSLLFFVAVAQTHACDVCGCAAGGSYFGILPGFQQNTIGLRYYYRGFNSANLPSLTGEWEADYSHSLERYHTAEIWGRYFISRRLQAFAFLPYNVNFRNELGKETRISGLGDARLMLAWTAFNSGDSLNKNGWKQSLLVSAGVKAATGRFGIEEGDGSLNPNLQPGTGSWDALASFYYTLRREGGGISLEGSWKQSGTNKQGYRYGNRLSGNLRGFHWFQMQGASLLAYTGLQAEHGQKDQQDRITQLYSGGNTLFANLGAEAYIGHLNPGASFQYPLAWEISEGIVKPGPQFRINLSYIF